MRFGLLGPVLVEVSERVLRTASARQRAVLATLLLSANRTVSVDELVDVVWGGEPAGSARELVRTYVWRLRAQLAESDLPRLLTEPAGYLLRVEAGEFDLEEFARLRTEGHSALRRGDAELAGDALRAALGLWRGEPLADVTLHSAWAASEILRLREDRMTALEDRIDADLALDRHGGVIGELVRLTAEHPFRERLAGQLMTACYRAGRQADALAAYERIRVELADELGADPGRELRELHVRILRDDPALRAARTSYRVTGPVVPRQLPAVASHFTGRRREIEALTGLLDRLGGTTGIAVISAINGTAGIGKTTLAVHWGRLNTARFPDGQIYINLRGHDPGARRMTPAEALGSMLDALSVPGDRIPLGLDARAALYRSVISGKRLLVVLDDAYDTEQVRPLLPGGHTCLTIVTSRRLLGGLVAAEAAQPIVLNLLTAAEANELLTARLGADRTRVDPVATAALIELCARLPLALSIAAARAAMRGEQPLAELVNEIRAARARLDALNVGDSRTNLRAVFHASYQHLTAPAARAFRLLGLHLGPDIAAPAAAGLIGLPAAEIRAVLGELVTANLLVEHVPGRFASHDLLRIYAAEQAEAQETDDERDAAAHRMFDHYLHTAHRAENVLEPARRPLTLPEPCAGAEPERLADYGRAVAWLDAQSQILPGLVHAAHARRWDDHTWQIAWCLRTYYERRGLWSEWLSTQHLALDSARRLGDTFAESSAHRSLAHAYTALGRPREALPHLEQAAELNRRAGDRLPLGATYFAFANAFELLGAYGDALSYCERALAEYRAVNHELGQQHALNTIAWCQAKLGDHQAALETCGSVLTLMRQAGDQNGEAAALDTLGFAYHGLKRYRKAIDNYRQALRIRRELGIVQEEAGTLDRLADVHVDMGDAATAVACRRQALALFDSLNHPSAHEVRDRLLRDSNRSAS